MPFSLLSKVFNFKFLAVLIATPFILVLLANYSIKRAAKDNTYFKTGQIPANKVGMVLGTVKTLSNGRTNLYFQYRIDAAVELYQAGKIDYVLVSGDNSRKDYDEPTDFKNELTARGIPADKIFLDYAGFRTLDSVVRAKEIFGQESLTIISQKFHNERAIFLAEKKGISAIGFNARDISGRYGWKTQVREYFARTKAALDILLGVQPKFLGEQIQIS